MSAQYLVIATFKFIDASKEAIERLRSLGVSDINYYSPFPCHDLDDEAHKDQPRSDVRLYTLLGGTLGCLAAFLMTSWMSVDYPVRVSAKPLLSYPSFVIIAFECTILLGAIFTLIGMLHNSRIPNLKRSPGFRPQFTEGRFGVVAKVNKERVSELKELFRSLGAERIEEQYER